MFTLQQQQVGCPREKGALHFVFLDKLKEDGVVRKATRAEPREGRKGAFVMRAK